MIRRASRHLVLFLAASLVSCSLERQATPRLDSGHLTGALPTLGHRIRIASWNVHKRNDSVFLADLHRLLDTTQADIFLMQECAVPSEPEHFQEALGNRFWTISVNLTRSSPPEKIGVVTAMRARPQTQKALLSQATEPVIGTAKASLVGTYPMEDGLLTVVNIHALNFSPDLDGFRAQISAITKVLEASPGPAIVGGDFNTWTRRKSALLDSLLAARGLVPVDFGDQTSLLKSVFGNPLDRIYYTREFLALDSMSPKVHGSLKSSDHAPLSVEFILKARTVSPP